MRKGGVLLLRCATLVEKKFSQHDRGAQSHVEIRGNSSIYVLRQNTRSLCANCRNEVRSGICEVWSCRILPRTETWYYNHDDIEPLRVLNVRRIQGGNSLWLNTIHTTFNDDNRKYDSKNSWSSISRSHELALTNNRYGQPSNWQL